MLWEIFYSYMIIGHFSIHCGKSRDENTSRDAGIFRENLDLSLGKVKHELILIVSV